MVINNEYREKIRKRGISLGREFAARKMETHAASIAFFLFLSIVPMVILLASLIPFTGLTMEALTEAALEISPDYTDDLIVTVISEAYSKSNGLLPISAAVLILSSSQGMMAVIRGMNATYRADERRNIIVLQLLSMLYTVVLLALIAVMLYVTFGPYLLRLFFSSITGRELPESVVSTSHLLISLGLSVFLFALIYTLCPYGRRNFFCQLPGALFTAAAWYIFSYFFSLYVNGANKYTLFYGSLGAVAVFLFWMYCCVYILLIGGFINQLFEPQIKKILKRSGKEEKKSGAE